MISITVLVRGKMLGTLSVAISLLRKCTELMTVCSHKLVQFMILNQAPASPFGHECFGYFFLRYSQGMCFMLCYGYRSFSHSVPVPMSRRPCLRHACVSIADELKPLR